MLFSGCQEKTTTPKQPVGDGDGDSDGDGNNNGTITPPLEAKTLYVDDDGGQNYTTIGAAVRDANPGDTIFVYAGIYYETVHIEKTLTLRGEHTDDTIIQYNGSIGDNTNVVLISEDNCSVEGFTIRTDDSSTGVIGIKVEGSRDITLRNNTLLYFERGIYLSVANNNQIIGNYIAFSNDYGLKIQESNNNLVKKNNITDNKKGALCCCGSINNIIYDNIFYNNIDLQAYDLFHNQWDDNGIGNYWSSYQGNDTNGDGFGDTPYNITGGDSQDRYPLMTPSIL
jgi:parallel beta-helix repeat protein